MTLGRTRHMLRVMKHSVIEAEEQVDNALVERALPLLPEVGKLLYTAVARHPLLCNLSMTQVKALWHVHAHGQRTMGEIAEGIGVSLPAASEVVDRLVEAGLAVRGSNPADRRQVLVGLTPDAEALATEMRRLRRAQIRAAMQRLPSAERPVFVHALAALVEALREEPVSEAPGRSHPATAALTPSE